jgi:hypothetical protein
MHCCVDGNVNTFNDIKQDANNKGKLSLIKSCFFLLDNANGR